MTAFYGVVVYDKDPAGGQKTYRIKDLHGRSDNVKDEDLPRAPTLTSGPNLAGIGKFEPVLPGQIVKYTIGEDGEPEISSYVGRIASAKQFQVRDAGEYPSDLHQAALDFTKGDVIASSGEPQKGWYNVALNGEKFENPQSVDESYDIQKYPDDPDIQIA